MMSLVCGVILLSMSPGSMLNDSSISANTGSAPASTMALKQEPIMSITPVSLATSSGLLLSFASSSLLSWQVTQLTCTVTGWSGESW